MYTTGGDRVGQTERAALKHTSRLLLSRLSRARPCAAPSTAAHQAPPSLGFPRQEHWSGLPFPSPVHESGSERSQLCPTLSDPTDWGPLGSSIHGIFQARVLEWGAVAFSETYTLPPVKQRASRKLLYDAGSSTWSSVRT